MAFHIYAIILFPHTLPSGEVFMLFWDFIFAHCQYFNWQTFFFSPLLSLLKWKFLRSYTLISVTSHIFLSWYWGSWVRLLHLNTLLSDHHSEIPRVHGTLEIGVIKAKSVLISAVHKWTFLLCSSSLFLTRNNHWKGEQIVKLSILHHSHGVKGLFQASNMFIWITWACFDIESPDTWHRYFP